MSALQQVVQLGQFLPVIFETALFEARSPLAEQDQRDMTGSGMSVPAKGATQWRTTPPTSSYGLRKVLLAPLFMCAEK
jgi:hypothetical protein